MEVVSLFTHTEPVESPPRRDPRQRYIDDQLLAEIDPSNKLPADERRHRLALARKEYFRKLATSRVLSEGSVLQSLIKATARAITDQARRMAAEEVGRDGG
jgi:hypothetical protein